jgi:hypothetical protein
MPNRRELVALGASAALVAATKPALAAGTARLETRLFNFRDGLSASETAEIVEAFKRDAKAAGLVVGRNIVPVQFPGRFEWIYMARFAQTAPPAFEQARDALASHCRDEVHCDIDAALPAGFADLTGVKVRHTVMFDFKPDATPEARARNVDAIRGMGKLPMVRSYIVAPAATAGSDPGLMQWQVIGDFASVADYHAYSEAPVHLAIRDDFTAHTARVVFLDVEV